jgi:hypothetical protein
MDKLKTDSVKAVMTTLNVSLNDLVANDELMTLLRSRLLSGELRKNDVLQLLSEMPDFQPKTARASSCKMLHFATHGATGIEYALNGGDVIGPIIEGKGIRYVLALKNIAVNLTIDEAEKLAGVQESIGGFKWIVPNDDHFKAMLGNLSKINRFIEAYDGDKIGNTPFLSASFQSNKPQRWNVRLILPLPLKI